MIPKTILDVIDYLRTSSVILARGGGDARQDSAISESKVIHVIQNASRWIVQSPSVETANSRSWYDARIEDFYVDVKISTCRTYDNTNAKGAIYWLLTGLRPDKTTNNQAKVFFPDMKSQEKYSKTRDYFYVIVNKGRSFRRVCCQFKMNCGSQTGTQQSSVSSEMEQLSCAG